MKNSRLPPLTKRFKDESTTRHFQFSFYCDRCGEGRQYPARPFSAADRVTDFDRFTTAQRLVYDAEYECAYEHANREAMGYFFACTDCGRYICEDCMAPSYPGAILCPECVGRR